MVIGLEGGRLICGKECLGHRSYMLGYTYITFVCVCVCVCVDKRSGLRETVVYKRQVIFEC